MSNVIRTKNEIYDLDEIMELVEEKGKQGSQATKWYAEIRGIIDARKAELHERLTA